MAQTLIETEQRDGVCTLILNRPEKRNALSPAMLAQLGAVLERLAADETVRVLVVRGAGDRAFCAGYDAAAIPTDSEAEIQAYLAEKPLDVTLQKLSDFPVPTIAMLNGGAFGGGCELAVCCDLRVGADDVRVGMPPAKLGVVYSPVGYRRFIQTIGLTRTREVFFTGRTYQGAAVREIGLADHLVPRPELSATVAQLAAEIATNAPLSVRGSKTLLNALADLPAIAPPLWKTAETLMAQAFRSEDLKEGLRALAEKRKPAFRGK